jgi:thioredoxin-related protein
MYSKILLLSLFVCFALCAKSKAEPSRALSLEILTYEDAVIMANNNDCEIYVLFVGSHCSWCEKQKAVLMDPEVINSLKKYVIAFIDIERKDLTRKFKVRSIPDHFILTKDEKIRKNKTGYQDKKNLLKMID